jgi:tRNA(His) 5'-end guanylyltransferase
MWPSPEIPRWAKESGCPLPLVEESFYTYVNRLGLDFDEVVADLDSRCLDLANQRLAEHLKRGAPNCFRNYYSV